MNKTQFSQFQQMLSVENKSQALLTKIRAYSGMLQQSGKLDDLRDFIDRLDLVVIDFANDFSKDLE